jgi:hypothetical protein
LGSSVEKFEVPEDMSLRHPDLVDQSRQLVEDKSNPAMAESALRRSLDNQCDYNNSYWV